QAFVRGDVSGALERTSAELADRFGIAGTPEEIVERLLDDVLPSGNQPRHAGPDRPPVRARMGRAGPTGPPATRRPGTSDRHPNPAGRDHAAGVSCAFLGSQRSGRSG